MTPRRPGGAPNTPWIKCFHARPEARIRLLCFPFAGGSASAFRTWHEYLPREVEIWPVQLPGREGRVQEAPFRSRVELFDAFLNAAGPSLTSPFCIFGHSLGAGLAFELTRELRRRGERLPEHVFLSARRAPQLPRTRPPIHNLSDAELIEALRRYNGTPPAVLDDPELLGLFLPTIRADFSLNEEPFTPEPPLDLPITVLGGLRDDRVSIPDLEAWREHTTASFFRQMFPGDHFYLVPSRRMLLEVIGARMAKHMR